MSNAAKLAPVHHSSTSTGTQIPRTTATAAEATGAEVRVRKVAAALRQARNTPLRLPLGNETLDRLNAAAQQTQDERAAWESVSRGTDFTE
ncbi:hypothetical protein [Micromonospora sp. NPDC005171]|uniref:hypothetical protein n=1 Tax=Micromonospora sp. NPDC005171 TaxID=3156866 RepID=UPI0033B2397F